MPCQAELRMHKCGAIFLNCYPPQLTIVVQGNFAHGDYFIDCVGVSLSLARAIFGVWINIWIAIIAISVRSIFRSHVTRRLLSGGSNKSGISIWHMSPATTSSEAFEIRKILARAIIKGDIFYVFASMFCILAAITSAASTTIANHAIVNNTVTRDSTAPGLLVTSEHTTISGALVEITNRVNALNRANAPLEELFDFVPNDDVNWIYSPNQWNNSWRGTCSYVMHPAVDLVVYPTNSSNYQDEVPLLGTWIPQWATVDPTKQGVDYVGFYVDAAINGSGHWVDLLVTYAFGSAPNMDPGLMHVNYATPVNFSLVNYLAHNIARDPYSTFLQTAFESDVHVVDCTFNHFGPGSPDEAKAFGGQYTNAAQNVGDVIFLRSISNFLSYN